MNDFAYTQGMTPTVQIPVVRGHFGGRVTHYNTTLSVQELRDVLKNDPRSSLWKEMPDDLREMYGSVQRTTNSNRITGLKRYIDDRFVSGETVAGGFPAISIAFQNWCRFEELPNTGGNMGFLHVSLSKANRGMIIDGLGRVSAALAILDEADNGDAVQRRRALKQLESFRFSCTIFLPSSPEETFQVSDFQQLFHDFNFLASPISKAHAIAIDHADIYTSLTRLLAKQNVIAKNGGMKTGAPSTGTQGRKKAGVAKAPKPLVQQSALLMFVRAALEGEEWGKRNAREKPETPNAKYTQIDEIGTDLAEFLSDFADAMGENFLDRRRLHLTAKGWFALGAIYHDLKYKLGVPGLEEATKALARIDWTAQNKIWSKIVDLVPAATPTSNGYKFATTGFAPHQDMLDAIRRELQIDSLLREKGLIA